MTSFDEKFVENNKNALMEEMAEKINSINELLSAIIQAGPTENPVHELSIMKNVTIAIAQHVGALTSCFNQYTIFETGRVPKERLIGFKAMIDNDDDEKEK